MITPRASAEPELLPSLSIARTIVWPTLNEQVRSLQQDLARVCLHRLGLTDSDTGTGKLVRAGLVMAAAAGLGVPPEHMRIEATAVELLHSSSLLHDDIIDDDRTRRGSPSARAAFGVPRAVLAGEAMQAAGLRILLNGDNRQARSFADAIGLVAAGQAGELALRIDPPATVARYEQAAAQKTSTLLECSLAAAAIRIGAPDATLDALRGAGRHLGIAWQAANDIEDIWGGIRLSPASRPAVTLSGATSPCPSWRPRPPTDRRPPDSTDCGSAPRPARRTYRRSPMRLTRQAGARRPKTHPAATLTWPSAAWARPT